jgi:hypothetical protein
MPDMPDEMHTHGELLSSGNPFWFASEELLTDLLRDEIQRVKHLLARHPALRDFFDLPDASVEQRAACFAVMAHRTLIDWIDETFSGRYQAAPSLGDEEKDVLGRTQNLFADDAPSWVLEANGVAELLPSHLRRATGATSPGRVLRQRSSASGVHQLGGGQAQQRTENPSVE